MTVDEAEVEVALWVTGNEQEFDRLRQLSYSNSHVILVCFAIDDPDSFQNIRERVTQFVYRGVNVSGSQRCSVVVKGFPSL